jgi:predicted Ser/Thr protein kinase
MAGDVSPEFLVLQEAVIGRYSLERELGRGGMGIVFLARDVSLDRPVAIKLLPPALAARPELRRRFLAEARTAAKLSQPNIVPIHAVEEIRDLVFFVMSYIEGETLGERLRTRGPLTPADAARLLQEVAWALAYAHGRGVVHRDVKPDNIMIERATSRSFVMDFGIAGTTASEGEVLGTAQYICPEQANGEPVDGRGDIYSLGVVGFLALSGRLPFEATDAAGYVAMHVTMPAPPLSTIMGGAPRKLAHAIDRCLAKAPGDRFPTGEALAEAVAQSVEPKRELPVPLRLWLTPGAESRAAYLIWYALLGFPVAFGAGAVAASVLPEAVAVMTGIGVYGFTPIGLHTSHRVLRLRKLIASGFGLTDLRLALRDLAARRREEVSYEFGGPAPRWARVVHHLRLASIAVFFGSFAALVLMSLPDTFAPLAIAGGVVTLVTSVINHYWPGKPRTSDRGVEWRVRFWNSRFGEWFARLAGAGVKRKAVAAELTYRPTELAIGIAADAVFETLPKEQKKELKSLPALVERLQRDAQLMRRSVDDLNEALAGIGDSAQPSRSAALHGTPGGAALSDTRERLRADLVRKRDEASHRLGEALSALESIRLNLLRLKAGTGTVSELTSDLAAAAQVREQLVLAADSQAEVEQLLRGARRSAATEAAPRAGGSAG